MSPMNSREVSTEEQLRAEIDELKRKLAAVDAGHARPDSQRPSSRTLLVVALLLMALAVAGYFLGYVPRQHREQVLAAEARVEEQSLPVINVQRVTRSAKQSSLVLPGNIQAITEAPVLARATGYIRKRYVDSGDRVAAGQVLAEIEAPELTQQIKQAQATIDQANSTVQQAQAALLQGRANENLAKVTADRWNNLLTRGVVSRQDRDTYQAQYESRAAALDSLEKAIGVQRSLIDLDRCCCHWAPAAPRCFLKMRSRQLATCRRRIAFARLLAGSVLG